MSQPTFATPNSKALVPWNTSENSGLALACIPWAGAGASLFRPWGPVVGKAATVYGVRLAGRESRRAEPPVTSLAQVVDETAQELARLGVPQIALFGQCSGALLAFELAKALLKSRHDVEVTHLVIASQLPPSVFATIDVESGQDLMQYVPEDFREEPDLVEVLLPIIAADMNLVSGYSYSRDVPLEIPITVIHGGRDKMLNRAKVDGWRLETTGPTNFYEVVGGDHLLGGAAWLKLARMVRAVLT